MDRISTAARRSHTTVDRAWLRAAIEAIDSKLEKLDMDFREFAETLTALHATEAFMRPRAETLDALDEEEGAN